jgi:hypothetical protein
MLYGRWRQIAQERGHSLALRDLAAGREWSFAELAAQAEAAPADGGPVAYPQGLSAEFIFALLRAWRGNIGAASVLGTAAALLPPQDHLRDRRPAAGRRFPGRATGG